MKLVFQLTGSLVKHALDIYDEAETLVYKVRSKNLMFGAKSSITDASDNELAQIKQRVGLTYNYDIFKGDDKIANIKKKTVSVTPKFTISGLDWKLEGKFLTRQYTIKGEAGQMIAEIGKQGLLQGGGYECDIVDPTADPLIVVALVSAIDIATMQK